MRVAVLCLAFLLITDPAQFESSTRPSVADFRSSTDDRGGQALDGAIEALGGIDRLKTMTSITMRGTGQEYSSAQSQGYHPERQTSADYEETLVVHPSQEKLAFEQRTGKGDQTVRWRRWLYTGNERVVGDFLVRARFARRNIPTATERARQARRIPHLLLMEASRHPIGLQMLKETSLYGGKRHYVVLYTPPEEKVTLRLFFDAETHLLSKSEYRMDFPTLGDVVVEYTYSGYRKDQRLGWVPAHHAIIVAGNTSLAVSVEMAANNREAEEIFQLPEFGAGEAGERFQLPDLLRGLVGTPGDVVEAARGVNVVEVGGFTLMFIEFKDFILAVEAPAAHPTLTNIPGDNQPGSTSLSETFIQKIKDKVPGKPIKYLAVTHYHSDHSGGARAFMAEGATILTTPGNKRFFEKMAAASHTLVPDRLSRNGRKARIETFANKRVITDGARTVELINIGPNPHTQENLIIYIPAERILFQGDLFYFDLGAPFPPKNRRAIMSFFARWLRENRLAPERIYNVHGHGFATMEHVIKAQEIFER
jgi:glyoxylase-like metal-dependent hydrolase (beta-lactamase superfamily II)